MVGTVGTMSDLDTVGTMSDLDTVGTMSDIDTVGTMSDLDTVGTMSDLLNMSLIHLSHQSRTVLESNLAYLLLKPSNINVKRC